MRSFLTTRSAKTHTFLLPAKTTVDDTGSASVHNFRVFLRQSPEVGSEPIIAVGIKRSIDRKGREV